MAKFLPIVQIQMDLKAKLAEAKLADYFERLCQQPDDTYNALWRALAAEPNAKLIVKDIDDTPPGFSMDADQRVHPVGGIIPSGNAVFVSPRALLALVQEAKAIYAMSSELLRWMKEKKLDQ